MNFKNEDDFRNWLCIELSQAVPEPWIVLKGKNVADIILSRQDNTAPLLVFLEVKYHKAIHGRIPIGSCKGSGYQPEYLQRKIYYLESYLRWIICDETSESCLLLTNEEIRNHAVGGIMDGKHNNLKLSVFSNMKSLLIPYSDIPSKILNWIATL